MDMLITMMGFINIYFMFLHLNRQRMKIAKLVILFVGLLPFCEMDGQSRWKIQSDQSIKWSIGQNIPHYDHIEMGGEMVATVLRYGVNSDGTFSLERSVIWPMLRTIPNDTHASLTRRFSVDFLAMLQVNGLTLNNEQVKSIQLDGKLTVVSEFTIGHTRGTKAGGELVPTIELTRVFFPSVDKPMLCERYTVKNIGNEKVEVLLPHSRVVYQTKSDQGVDGSYTLVASTVVGKEDVFLLGSGESITFGASVQAYKGGQKELLPDIDVELGSRDNFIKQVWNNLFFCSPDTTLNTAFAFAKIRASESIYRTNGGLMHGPGGEAYYAAIWANDQAEYVNPFFPFLGYEVANEAAVNSYRHFARFMNPEYNPIPSSIIAEGKDIWNGAGDRGDAAMIAYGAARFALELGDIDVANELWPLIEWCLMYCKRKLNAEGVVTSDTDEMENRFPAGDANLNTSTLYYDALLSASYLSKELGKPASIFNGYWKEAEILRKNIARYFEADIEGYETYRYYKGNNVLRSWICVPLVAGIFDRKEGTVRALLSPHLWTENGLLSQTGTSTYWDRPALYALRGIYAAGEREKATRYLQRYSAQRLLGDHVPYPIEAWPEGNQRHLSAESGLYCRIITEGMFGIRPMGLHTFMLTPQLPDEWDFMELKNVYAFGTKPFDIRVIRNGNGIKILIKREGKIWKSYSSTVGKSIQVRLK